MHKSVVVLLLFLVFSSCSKQSELSKEIKCSNSKTENTIKINDFNKNFTISIPKHWKTELYYDNITSEIYSADTTKQLTETYILDASFNFGNVNINDDYIKKNDSIYKSNGFEITQSKRIKFQDKEGFYFIVKGKKKNFMFHKLNLLVKISENTYFNAFSDVYGEENVDARICEAISIIENVEFLQ